MTNWNDGSASGENPSGGGGGAIVGLAALVGMGALFLAANSWNSNTYLGKSMHDGRWEEKERDSHSYIIHIVHCKYCGEVEASYRDNTPEYDPAMNKVQEHERICSHNPNN